MQSENGEPGIFCLASHGSAFFGRDQANILVDRERCNFQSAVTTVVGKLERFLKRPVLKGFIADCVFHHSKPGKDF